MLALKSISCVGALTCCLLYCVGAQASDAAIDKLVRAYPDFLTGHTQTDLIWKDGTRMPISDGNDHKTYAERLKKPSIYDQMLLEYPKEPLQKPPDLEADPGRFRNVAFFNKMYGDCFRGETQKSLVTVKWLPRTANQTLRITRVNGVSRALQAVSDELDALPSELKRYAAPSAGTFNCRVVKDTGNVSMHAWGAAIDLNTDFADYWLWRAGKPYRNRIPQEIVDVFEKHGFIWGGKWGHFDTMHFEYRPELLE